MSTNMLIRRNILKLEPYESARRIGGNGDVFLNANELPFPPFFQTKLNNLNRYPEPQPSEVIKRYADYAGVEEKQILVCRGADEGIELLMRVFCEPNVDSILYCPPTYGMYLISALGLGIYSKKVPTNDDWQLNLNAIEANLDSVKLVYVCSPNNPTGNLINPDDIKYLLNMVKGKALVVIDEAYIEFSQQPSAVNWLNDYPHLVILRTLSKAFALAGLRCGFVIADQTIIQALTKVIAPYPLATPTADIAIQALSAEGICMMRNNVSIINHQKQIFAKMMSKFSIVENVYHSQANYLLVKFKQGKHVVEQLYRQGIILRDQSSSIGKEGYIRITIGSSSECDRVISALANLQ